MKDSVIKNTLTESINKGYILSIFSNRNQRGRCSVGLIEQVTSQHVVMKHISVNGQYDGYILRRLEDIIRIDINGQYEKRLQTLYLLQKQQHLDLFDKKVKRNGNLVKEFLTYSMGKRLVVSVCIDETEEQEDIVGWVKDMNDTEVTISKISFEGYDDGETIFDICEIIKLNCDSLEERVLGLLNSNMNT